MTIARELDMAVAQAGSQPRVGMVATVRNRRGIIAGARAFDGQDGRFHLEEIEYKDDHLPASERLIWELEPRRTVVNPKALPDAGGADSVPAEDASLGLAIDGLRMTDPSPTVDGWFNALPHLIRNLLGHDRGKRDDERRIVFTEHRPTRDYLFRRLGPHYCKDRRILSHYGGTDDPLRESIKKPFNDPETPACVLVRTGATAKGMNVQYAAPYMLHYDCPPNSVFGSGSSIPGGRMDRKSTGIAWLF